MGIGTKTCKSCNKTVASAKKVCDCGHVFLEKKKRGFQESPIVITSDRLRSSREPDEDDGRPIRAKKHKYQDSDFIYSAGTSTSTKPQQAESGESTLNKTTYYQGEKLYPKRDRTKTSKFEKLFSNNLKQSDAQLQLSGDNNSIQEAEQSNAIDGGETGARKFDTFARKTFTGVDNMLREIGSDGEFSGTKLDRINNENEIDGGSTTLESEEILELSSDELLLQNIEACIEIVKDESKKIPLPTLSELSQDSSNSESEDIVEDDVCLTRVKIPKYIRKLMIKSRAELREDDDDVPLSHLMKNGPFLSGATIKDGKLKRPVGRPRKYPIVVDKIKRPVGRPRKEKTENKIEAKIGQPPKKKRGRPATAVPPLYGFFHDPYAALFDDDDDNDRDPDYKSPTKTLTSPMGNRSLERSVKRNFLSPNNMMSERMYQEIYQMDAGEDQHWVSQQSRVPAEKKELYSHILEEINRRIVSQQAFFVSLG
ncbi:uncharacterized protein [Clytia hemisphaerica]|uniref:Uncharacterized protein n=1 Tax=Clytia hemisphaerica TaxID=252671 RepID=A0A7M5X4B0_9CNID|eukprot:TCONS_00060830-protein